MIFPQPQSVLSLDIGNKRIGLAGCDPLGITVTQLDAIMRTNFKQDIFKLKSLCIKRDVKGLIIGLPLDELGNETLQSTKSKIYGLKIAKSLYLPLAWVNEHSSTWEAKERFNLENDRTGKLDSAAAALLLEQWLREGPELDFNYKTMSITNQD